MSDPQKLLPCPETSIEDMAMAEVAGTYTSPDARAAYRAGLSTAAAICDRAASRMGQKTVRARAQSLVLTGAADQISNLRERIEVPATPPEDNRLKEALKSAQGYFRNAKIDLETGAPKRTAIQTLEGGLKLVDAALSHGEDDNGK